MIAFKICLLLSTVLLASCHFATGDTVGFLPKPKLDGRIVGGFVIDISQVPWQVSLQTGRRHFCGGSILSEKWILTAAHCTMAVPSASRITVRLGSSENESGGVIHRVKRIVQHKQYNAKTIDYDYSLLELEKHIEFNANTKPVALPKAEERVNDNTTCLVSGWGNTQSSAESSRKLRGAEVPIVNQDKCNKAYKSFGGITERMVCAGFDKGGKDACQGDSGGPLVAFDDNNENAVIVGVVSWGYGCAQPTYPGVYSRVQVARDWISEKTGL